MELVDRGLTHVIGIEIEAPLEDLSLKTAAVRSVLAARLAEIPQRLHDGYVDVGLCAAHGLFTRIVGVEVADMAVIPGGMTGVTVPQQRYIHDHVAGREADIAATLGAMYAWAEREEILIDPARFNLDFTAAPHGAAHDIYLKLAA